jgi:hypothetical protein
MQGHFNAFVPRTELILAPAINLFLSFSGPSDQPWSICLVAHQEGHYVAIRIDDQSPFDTTTLGCMLERGVWEAMLEGRERSLTRRRLAGEAIPDDARASLAGLHEAHALMVQIRMGLAP